MENTFRSINTTKLQKVFARAHYLGYVSSNTPQPQRKQFQELARMIWDAAGEDKPMPAELPSDLTALGAVR